MNARFVEMSDQFYVAQANCVPGKLFVSISGADGGAYATPEQALEAAQALVEAALEIINARPAQALVVPGIGLTSVQS